VIWRPPLSAGFAACVCRSVFNAGRWFSAASNGDQGKGANMPGGHEDASCNRLEFPVYLGLIAI